KLPGISIDGKKIVLNIVSPFFPADAEKMDKVYNNPTDDDLELYSVESFYRDKFFQMVERTRPTEAIIHLLGPFSFSQMIMNREENQLLEDKLYRKYVVQALTVKAMWFVRRVKNLSPNTTPLIVFEEPRLNEFGFINKTYPEVTKEIVVGMFSKVFQSLKAAGAAICVQCFNKCDWQLPLEAGIDVLSFNAYTNPSNISIIADKITKFLEGGGYINWGIVPVMSEEMVKSLTTDLLANRFMKTAQGLVDEGVKRELIYSRSMVSVQGEFYNLPLIFTEKALMASIQLSERVFKK
ncbi:hypothetical protein IKQ21_02690, partial [bacterium]|nr:hypothetical protein [bacterium]